MERDEQRAYAQHSALNALEQWAQEVQLDAYFVDGWVEAISNGDEEAIRGWNMPSSAPHCDHCALPFDPEVSRHSTFCCERCFQDYWDYQDGQVEQEDDHHGESLQEVWGGEERIQEEENDRVPPTPYSSQANIASIMARIQAATPGSDERLSYILKLFICLNAEDRELLSHTGFRQQVLTKINQFDTALQEHPEYSCRIEIRTAMNRTREIIHQLTPPPA